MRVLSIGIAGALLLALSLPGQSFAASAEEWIQKGTNAIVELSKGNTESAVRQAIPYRDFDVSRHTAVQAGPQGVDLQQNLPQLNRFGGRLGGVVNAKGNLDAHRRPQLSPNAQLTASSPYFSNNFSVSPKLPQKKR